MPHVPQRFLLAVLALVLAISAPPPIQAQPTGAQARDSTARTDSLRAALDSFQAADPPTPADSARLRTWADSVTASGNEIRGEDPAAGRTLLTAARTAYRALADSAMTASVTKDVGVTYYKEGAIDEAVRRFRTALASTRRNDAPGVEATCLNWLAIFHVNQGRYDEARDRWQAALSISRSLEDRERTSNLLNNIGILYDRQGRDDEALPRYEEALALSREREDEASVAIGLTNVGLAYSDRGRTEKAQSHLEEALAIFRNLGYQERIGEVLGSLGGIYEQRGNDEKALQHYREALALSRKTEKKRRIAGHLHDVGRIQEDRGHPEVALSHYRDALSLFRDLGHPERAASLESIGELHLTEGRVRAAADTLSRAVRIAETLRQNATSPTARRSLLSIQIGAYRALTTAHVRAGRPDSALRAVEQARARLLADQLAGTATGDTTFTIPSVPELRRTLDSNEAALLYANAGTRWPLTGLVVTRDRVYARELPDSTMQSDVGNAYASRLDRLRRVKGPLTAALGSDETASTEEHPSLAETVRLYRYYLTRDNTGSSIETDLAQRLHDLLAAPLTAPIQDRAQLTVVPAGALGYLPFETLQDSTGQYLVEQHHVRYAQSLTVLRQLQQRNYDTRPRSLLAFGGADYVSKQGLGNGTLVAEARGGSTQVATNAQAAALFRSADRRMEQGRSPRPTYQQLGYRRWSNLPATKTEVKRLAQIAGPGATVRTGSGVSEDTVRALGERGRLPAYRRLHFATHGIAVPEAPKLSALVLSQVGTSDSLAARDGYLTMEEIADLEMKAEVAVLSACQTGLGRIVAGEGVVSLSHAFLRAGANATLVSQWKVLDQSTRQFMTTVYKRAKNEDTSFAEAVTETKHAFIDGTYGEKNTDPLRWAPFVYYGRE